MCYEKISVIVPVYGVENYLEKCVKSICNQTYRNLEIILVDDGSPDKCGDICDKLSLQDDRILVIHKENGGVSSARNIGLDIATGDYIAFVDSDDYIEPRMYEVMIKQLKHDMSDVVECSANIVNEKYEKIGACQFYNEVLDGKYILLNFLKKINSNDYVHWRLFKKDIIGKLRFPNLKCSEDYVFLSKLNLKCKRKSTIDNKLYNYLIRDTSVGGQLFSAKKLDVIKARNIMNEYYYENNLINFISINSVQAISRIIDLYIEMRKCNFNKEEKNKYKKILLIEYNIHYKNALDDKEFFLRKKSRRVKYFLFKVSPDLYFDLFYKFWDFR